MGEGPQRPGQCRAAEHARGIGAGWQAPVPRGLAPARRADRRGVDCSARGDHLRPGVLPMSAHLHGMGMVYDRGTSVQPLPATDWPALASARGEWLGSLVLLLRLLPGLSSPSRVRRRAGGSRPADPAGVGGFLAMNIMLFSLLLYGDAFPGADAISGGDAWLSAAVPWVLWGLATPLLVVLGGPFLRGAWTPR